MKRRIFLTLILVAVLVSTVACSSRSFDAKELALIGMSGANGFGVLTVKPDDDRIRLLLAEESTRLDENDEKGFQRLFQREAALSSLIFTADRNSGLKNGDEVTIRADYDHQLAKEAGIRFRNTRFEYVVGDLKEAVPVDIESHVSLTFSGYDGRGVAALSLSGDVDQLRQGFEFEFTRGNADLSNGHSIGVKVIPDNRFLTARGRIARETLLSFEITGLPSLTEINIFEDLVLMYDGISDQGVVSFDTTRLPADWVEAGMREEAPVRFTALPSADLSNGDTVKVQAMVDSDWFAKRGLIAAQTEKEYMVMGLKEYPRNLDGVDLMPLFDKIAPWLEQDVTSRLDRNYWNDDFRTGDPLSQWDYSYHGGVTRLFYGYDQTDRARNFVAILYKAVVKGNCREAIPYQSAYSAGDKKTSTLYLLYLVEEIMYDRPAIDDFREINLRLHGDVELDLIASFKDQYGGHDMLIVDASVPDKILYKETALPYEP